MPTITITGTDKEFTRIKNALKLSTDEELKELIVERIKNEVKISEINKVTAQEDAKLQEIIESKNTAIEAAESKPDVELL